MDMPSKFYPSFSSVDAQEAFAILPISLTHLLQILVTGKYPIEKIASLGKAVAQASRPTTLLSPLMLGLGVQLHYMYASRFLYDSLHAMGFSCSYNEVIKYERSAALQQGTELPGFDATQFVQHIADNADHNTRTLDGLGTFHAMGIMATITPAIRLNKLIPRINVALEDIKAVGQINIASYTHVGNGRPLLFQKLPYIYI